jgi:hypothetical protein
MCIGRRFSLITDFGANILREVLGADKAVLAYDRGIFEDILQFPDIAREIMGH